MKKDAVLYSGILLSHQKEWINAICCHMDRPREYHTKWTKQDRQSKISYDIAYMWNQKKKRHKWTYLYNRNRPTDIENKLMITKREDGERSIRSFRLTYTHCKCIYVNL